MKVIQGGQAYERNSALPKSMGWHWRRWYGLHQKGELSDEYFRQVVCGKAALDSLVSERRVYEAKPHFAKK
jgi:hypothetical protein